MSGHGQLSPVPLHRWQVSVRARYVAGHGVVGQPHANSLIIAPDRALAVEIGLAAARGAMNGAEGQLLDEPRVVRAGRQPGHDGAGALAPSWPDQPANGTS